MYALQSCVSSIKNRSPYDCMPTPGRSEWNSTSSSSTIHGVLTGFHPRCRENSRRTVIRKILVCDFACLQLPHHLKKEETGCYGVIFERVLQRRLTETLWRTINGQAEPWQTGMTQ